MALFAVDSDEELLRVKANVQFDGKDLVKNTSVLLDTGATLTWFDSKNDVCEPNAKNSQYEIAFGSSTVDIDMIDAGAKLCSDNVCVPVGSNTSGSAVSDAKSLCLDSVVGSGLMNSSDSTIEKVEDAVGDGLVGLACQQGGMCSAIGLSGQTFIYDKAKKFVCLGGQKQCSGLRRQRAKSSVLDMTEAFPIAGNCVLDTGSTYTSDLDADTQSALQTAASCVVGIQDINYMELDYGKGIMRYDVSASAQKKIDGV